MHLDSERVAGFFRKSYGSDPEVIASAPGRVNLIGEHLDYNGGEVLPMAIERRTWVAMRQRSGESSRVVSSSEESTGSFNRHAPNRSGKWWDYVSGLGALPGKLLPAVDIAVVSDVPSGAGLSSSAALAVATGRAYDALGGGEIVLREIARAAWRVENAFVGVDCGIMDQFASALAVEGSALHLWCATMLTEHVPFKGSVLVFDTAVPRSLRHSDFNTRRAECAEALRILREQHPELQNLASVVPSQIERAELPRTLVKRVTHVASEMERVRIAVAELGVRGTIDAQLMYDSHASLRDQYECSSPELNWFVEHAADVAGIGGARLTGAGWGGCAIAIGAHDALSAAGARLARDYEQRFHRVPRLWLTKASAGARLEHR